MSGWNIRSDRAKLVYEPANFDIDLRVIANRDDVKAVLADLERESFATQQIIREAESMLNSYLVWLQGQERVKRVRSQT